VNTCALHDPSPGFDRAATTVPRLWVNTCARHDPSPEALLDRSRRKVRHQIEDGIRQVTIGNHSLGDGGRRYGRSGMYGRWRFTPPFAQTGSPASIVVLRGLVTARRAARGSLQEMHPNE
jgi:hypothetical protein